MFYSANVEITYWFANSNNIKHSLRQHFARLCVSRNPFITLRVQYVVRCIHDVVWFVHYVVRLYNMVNGVCGTRVR